MRELDRARFGNLFASSMLDHVWADGPEFNAQLRPRILEHARRYPSEARSNFGGSHSEA